MLQCAFNLIVHNTRDQAAQIMHASAFGDQLNSKTEADFGVRVRRAGTLAIAGDLGGLNIANTGTGTIYTSGVTSGASTAVSGSGKTILIPTGGECLAALGLSYSTKPYCINNHDSYLHGGLTKMID